MWELATPLALLLLPVPLIARRLMAPRPRESGAVFVPAGVLDAVARPALRGAARRFLAVLPALIWLCLVVALAGPRQLTVSAAVPASGREIVLALDLSGSMEKEDFALGGTPLSRLEAVKQVGESFVLGRQGDRLGLVVFADAAYFAAPMTFDVRAVARAIQEATIGISGRSTAISDGLGLAIKRLADSDAAARVVILLSDGVDTTGDVTARDVAALASDHGIRVHTIALGPDDLETTPASRDAVDTATLRAVAEASGGETFRVRTLNDLLAVGETLDRLEPSPRDRPPVTLRRDYWHWPALAALLLAAVSLALREEV